jgi:hypothetical protein
MFTADSGYVVLDVLVDGLSVGAVGSYTFTNVISSHAISVSFAQGYTLMVTTAGTGTGDVAKNPSATVYRPGTKVTLKAIKADSSIFLGFSGDCNTYRTSCTIVMNRNAAVTAAFKLKTFRVKTKVIGNGAVSMEGPVSLGDGTEAEKTTKTEKVKKSIHETMIDYGDQLTFRIMPEPGNNIKKVVVDSKSIGAVNLLSIADIKRNHSVKIKFESDLQLTKNTQLATNKYQILLRDEEGREDLQAFADDLKENDDDDSPITESSSTNYYTSGKR